MVEKQVKDYEKFVVCFFDGMCDVIVECVKQNGRFMNLEIVQIFEDVFENCFVKVQSEMNIDFFVEQGVDDDRIVILKS